jgi:hypothetical protein
MTCGAEKQRGHLEQRNSRDSRSIALETAAVFLSSLGLLLSLGAFAPFTKELGACESGAVREVLAGAFILPHYRPGSSIVWVPPLSWWTQALAVKMLGWREVALRLPSLLSAAFTVALFYAWLRSSVGRSCALWTAVALLSCRFFIDAARQPRQDALFAALVSAAMVFFELTQRCTTRHRTTWLVVTSITMTLATLTKGPLGLVLPGLAIVLWMLAEGRLRELFRPGLIAAFGCASALALLWYGAAYAVGGREFVDVQIVLCLWDRFTGKLAMCRHPFYYFLPYVVTGFLPWGLLVPFVGIALWNGRRLLPSPVRLAVFWFLGFLAFFSASRGKCLAYLVPVFPPLAILTGWAVADLLTNRTQQRLERVLWRLGVFLAGAGLVALALSASMLETWGVPRVLVAKLHSSDRTVLALLAALPSQARLSFAAWLAASTAAGMAAIWGAAAERARTGFFGLALGALVGTAFWFGVVTPSLARKATLKPFFRQVNLIVPPRATLAYLGDPDCDASFYSEHALSVEFDQPPPCGGGRQLYFIAPEDQAARLTPSQRACISEVTASSTVDSHGRRILFVTH